MNNTELYNRISALYSQVKSLDYMMLPEISSLQESLLSLMNDLRPDLNPVTNKPVYEMKYFTLSEFEASSTAKRMGLDNRVRINQVRDNLYTLVEKVLDPAREKLGSPIRVNSGFRNSSVNRLVNGAANSYHLYGRAADVAPVRSELLSRLYQILLELPHVELIPHETYIHVAL